MPNTLRVLWTDWREVDSLSDQNGLYITKYGKHPIGASSRTYGDFGTFGDRKTTGVRGIGPGQECCGGRVISCFGVRVDGYKFNNL